MPGEPGKCAEDYGDGVAVKVEKVVESVGDDDKGQNNAEQYVGVILQLVFRLPHDETEDGEAHARETDGRHGRQGGGGAGYKISRKEPSGRHVSEENTGKETPQVEE